MMLEAALSVRHFLSRVYAVSFCSDIHSVTISDEQPGRGGSTVTELRLELALVRAAIRKTLGFGYLINSMDAIYSDDPEALCEAVADLDAWTHCGKRRALEALEHYKLMSFDGLTDCEPRTGEERVIARWMEFSLDILSEEFVARGWI